MGKRVFFSAGEISGDKYGALLAAAIRQSVTGGDYVEKDANTALHMVGMGGDAMRAAGVEVLWDVTAKSTVGFVEPLRHLWAYLRVYRQIKAFFKNHRPDVFVPIDFQGFNLLLCRAATAYGIPIVYFIGPQFWQWGTEAQAKSYLKLLGNTPGPLTIFKEETAYYTHLGATPLYVGHPVLALLPEIHLPRQRPITPFHIGVFPGSRAQEIHHAAPVLLAAAAQLQQRFGGSKVSVSVSHPRYVGLLADLAQQVGLSCVFVSGVPDDLLRSCDMGLVTSGTMTLQLALLGIPIVSVYRLHPFSYRLAKLLVGKKVAALGHISLPNLILNQRVVPEFLQDEATPLAIAAAAEVLLTDINAYQDLQKACMVLRQQLGSEGAIQRVAEVIARFVLDPKL